MKTSDDHGAPKLIPTAELHFDFENPRLVECGLSKKSTEDDIVKLLWDAMDVKEIVLSIAASGFFSHEALIIIEEKGKKVVIEGNRRLAAVKTILNPKLLGNLGIELPAVSKAIKAGLECLPTIKTTRKEAWQYLGFKHVNGPAKWGSYAKACYIATIHKTFKVPLTTIASQIGDTNKTVQRLYQGLMVIEQAETSGLFDREDRYRPHFSFSHMYTGLQYDSIAKFLSIKSEDAETTSPVPAKNKKQLAELCRWMYGSKKEKLPPVVESQNPDLGHLNAVVSNRESVAALRNGVSLEEAFQISRPTSTVFEESILTAKRSLQKARGLSSVGYDGSSELLSITQDVVELANDLHADMDRKRSELEKRR